MSSDADVQDMDLRGACYVLTAASGTGKSTVVRTLFREHRRAVADVSFSVSHTSRPPRDGEVEGEHYYFVSEDEFRGLIEVDAFLEWAVVHDQYKGTSLAEIQRLRGQGRDVLLEIDVQGAAQVRAKIPESVSIFLLPPSYGELERRLRGRDLDTAQQISRRLADAAAEIPRVAEFDYVIVNDDVGHAARALADVFLAGRHRRQRMRPEIERILASLPEPPPDAG